MSVRNQNPLWVIGSGGFLGSSIARYSKPHGFTPFPAGKVSWSDPQRRKVQLHSIASEFTDFSQGAKATIIWAAGQGGVTTQPQAISSEIAAFSDFVDVMTKSNELFGAQIIVCSSAGGVYGGSSGVPFSLHTDTVAINSYGEEKIKVEHLSAAQLANEYQILVARITNLYGAWPGLRQGLVNRLCTAAVIREPLQIYVSLDTIRDYLDVEDAAQLILLEAKNFSRQTGEGTPSPSIAIVGSGRATSLGEVIATVTDVSRRRIPISLADLAYKDLQPKDLRVVPTWIERGINYNPIELSVGVKRLIDSLVTQPRWT